MNQPRPRRVLLVEDDRIAAVAASAILRIEGAGFVLQRAARGARCAFRPGSYLLAVVDVGIPEHDGPSSGEADGIELARWLRLADPDLPILLWSATVDEARTARAVALGLRLVDKAVGLAEIRALVRSLLSR